MIFVDDGNKDSSLEVFRQLKKKSDISLWIVVLEKIPVNLLPLDKGTVLGF